MKVFQQYTIALMVLLAQAAFAEEDSTNLRGKHMSAFEQIHAKPVVGLSHEDVAQRCSLLKDLVFNSDPSLKITKGATLLSSCQRLFMSAEDQNHKVKLPVAKNSVEPRTEPVKHEYIVAASVAKTE